MAESGLFSIPYRIRIAVTGERFPKNLELLRDGLRKVLGHNAAESRVLELFGTEYKKILSSLRNTKIAFTLLTTYQEGVNRLVSEEIMKLPDSRVRVILPVPEGEYEKEFSSESSKDTFRAFIKNEASVRTPITLQKDISDRDSAILRAHHYIVDHCDVLFIVGDALPQAEVDFLEYAKRKKRPIIRIDNNSQIVFESGYGLNVKSLDRLDQYNTHHISPDQIELDSDRVLKDIFEQSGDNSGKIPAQAKSMVRKLLIPHYARASIVALRFQKYYKRTGNAVYACSALAVASVASGVLFHFHNAYILEFSLLFLILCAVLGSERIGAHKRWIETRFLAERIRSAIFLAAAGVEVSPIYLPPYMGAAHRQDDWMVMAFQEIWERTPPMTGCSREQCSLLSTFICRSWLDGQIQYHSKKAKTSHRRSHAFEFTGWALFAAALLLAAVHVFFPMAESEQSKENALIFFALWLPALAAAIEGIRKHNEYSRIATLSENMEESLRELKQRFEEVRSNESLDVLLRETDELMLRETQSWLMLMRFLKLEPVL